VNETFSSRSRHWRYLDQLEHSCGAFLSRDAQPSLFDRIGWFRLAEKHSLEGKPLVIQAANEKGRCWLFLDRDGSSAAPLSNWHCFRYAPVFQGETSRALIAGLVDELDAAGISHVRLDPMQDDDTLASILREKGWLVSFEEVNESWYVDTSGMTFEDYWATRPSRLRNTAKRKAKKSSLKFEILDQFCAQAWDDTQAVFAASWKKPDGKPGLLREIMETEGKAGALRLGLAYQDGTAVADQIWTVEHGTALIHQLAYREDAKDFSPGTQLSVELFRHVLNKDKVDRIDFGIGNDAYKREWMTDREPLFMLTAYNPRRLSGCWGLFKVGGRKLLSALRLRNEPVSYRDQSRQ